MTKFDRPNHFQDAMLEGAFHHMKHDHTFQESSSGTIMIDRFEFASPFGILGKIVDRFVLKNYLKKFILKRNAILKQTAESDAWKKYIDEA